MTGGTESGAASLRYAIDRDGLLDFHVGVVLLLVLGFGALGWKLMHNPGVFAALPAIFVAGSLGQLRKRYTYPRLGCPGYRPEAEVRFALVVLTATALLGLAVFALPLLFGTRLPGWFWRHSPAWLALAAAATSCLLAWWYRAFRYLGYGAVAVVAVGVGYALGLRTLLRLALPVAACGAVMTAAGAARLARFLRSHPRPAGSPGQGRVT